MAVSFGIVHVPEAFQLNVQGGHMSGNAMLYQNGYVQIPFSKAGKAHLKVDGHINGKDVVVLIGMGIPTTVIDIDFATMANLPMIDIAPFSGGQARPGEMFQVQGARFGIGNVYPRLPFMLAADLNIVMHALAVSGAPKVDIIIGSDVLEGHSAVIDYGSGILGLKL